MTVDAISASLRAASFISSFQAMGVAIYRALFASEVRRTADGVRKIGVITSVAAIVLTAFQYLLEAGRMSGALSGVLDSQLQQLSWESSLGTAWLMQESGLLVIVIGLISAHRGAQSAALLGSALCIGAFLLVGHTLHHPLLQIFLAVHLAVIGFWFGALWPLHLAASCESTHVLKAIVERFSALATWLVPAIFIAGLLLVFGLVPSPRVFLEPYGLIIIGKATLFSVLMGLAALNRNRFGPNLEHVRAVRAFRFTLVAEWLLIAVVLSATAVLTSLFAIES